MTYSKNIQGIGMHAIILFAVWPIIFHLGTNLKKLLSSKIKVASKRDFERSGVSMSRKIWVDLIRFHLTSYVNTPCCLKTTTCDIPFEEGG